MVTFEEYKAATCNIETEFNRFVIINGLESLVIVAAIAGDFYIHGLNIIDVL